MQKTTAISISKEVKNQLISLKRHPKEPYNDVVKRLITLAIEQVAKEREAIQGPDSR